MCGERWHVRIRKSGVIVSSRGYHSHAVIAEIAAVAHQP